MANEILSINYIFDTKIIRSQNFVKVFYILTVIKFSRTRIIVILGHYIREYKHVEVTHKVTSHKLTDLFAIKSDIIMEISFSLRSVG